MRRPDPRSMCVVAAGIVLAAGSVSPIPPAAPAAGPPAGGAELTAAELGEEQQVLAGSLTDALDPAGWTYQDGSALRPGTPPVPQPVACPASSGTAVTQGTGSAAGPRRHLLELQLAGPAPASPESARDRAQRVLLGSGADMLSALTPGPDAPPETAYTFTASFAGGIVKFSATDYEQTLQITSACSSDPALAATGNPAT
ncbi:hypothetical protein [Arthrobacter luteolus]|uniref:hypothetical protein n=1 Tax=Arthrobacter luteolus TaxID=98672 RepID=UPI00384DAB46